MAFDSRSTDPFWNIFEVELSLAGIVRLICVNRGYPKT
jgi:hypothetical protein